MRRPVFLLGNFSTLVLSIGLLGCNGSSEQSVEPVADVPRGQADRPSEWQDYALLLGRVRQGETYHPRRLTKNRELIEQCLARRQHLGPRSAPNKYDDAEWRLTYWINVHNLLVLGAVADALSSKTSNAAAPDAALERYRAEIDGRLLSVRQARDEALHEAGEDWRVHFALFTGRADGPPLPPRPFAHGLVDEQLETSTRAAMSSVRVARPDHGLNRRLLLWEGLYDMAPALVEDYERRYEMRGATILSVLLEWCGRFRRETLNSAVGYSVEAMPRDYSIPAR